MTIRDGGVHRLFIFCSLQGFRASVAVNFSSPMRSIVHTAGREGRQGRRPRDLDRSEISGASGPDGGDPGRREDDAADDVHGVIGEPLVDPHHQPEIDGGVDRDVSQP